MLDIRTSIIMLTYNAYHLTMERLSQFSKYLPTDCELVWVDNGSDYSDVKGNVEWWRDNFPGRLECAFLPENLGYSKGNNIGATVAHGRNLLFMNPDVVIEKPDFIKVMSGSIESSSGSLWGARLINWAAGWNQVGKSVFPYLDGYLLGCTKELWKKLGGFDEMYSPYDMEDLDLSVQATFQGVPLKVFPSGYVTHIGWGTFKANAIVASDRENQTKINYQKFVDKWKDKLDKFTYWRVE